MKMFCNLEVKALHKSFPEAKTDKNEYEIKLHRQLNYSVSSYVVEKIICH